VLEHALPHAGLGPAAEAPLHLDPTAEALGQIAPRDAGAEAVEHRLNEQPVVPGGHAHVTLTSRQQAPNAVPLVVTKAMASHQAGPHP